MAHCVYCFVFEEAGLIKIGHSSNVRSRFYQLKFPFGPASQNSLLLNCDEELARVIEKQVLFKFAELRLHPHCVQAKARGEGINNSGTEFFDIKHRRTIENYFLSERLCNRSVELACLGAVTIHELEKTAELMEDAIDILKQQRIHLSKFRTLLNAHKFFK